MRYNTSVSVMQAFGASDVYQAIEKINIQRDNISLDLANLTARIAATTANAEYMTRKIGEKSTALIALNRSYKARGGFSPQDMKRRSELETALANQRKVLSEINGKLTYLQGVLDGMTSQKEYLDGALAVAIVEKANLRKGAWLIERASQPVTETVQPVQVIAPVINRNKTPKPLPFLGRSFNLTDLSLGSDNLEKLQKAATFTVKMAWAKRAKTLAKVAA